MFNTIRDGLARYRNRAFMDASMAASALVAAADGEVSFAERHGLDQVLARLEQLKSYEVHVPIDRFQSYVDWILEDPEAGREAALSAIRPFREDAEASALLIRIAAAISRADGEVTDVESVRMAEIAETLALPREVLSGMRLSAGPA